MTDDVETVIRACARAHRGTGTPISTHTDAALRRGLEQQDVLESEGVDLSRVVIGHCGDSTDLAYLREVMARGSFIGMDRFGLEQRASFEDRVQTVVDLCLEGHADQMVLSHDAFCFGDWWPVRPPLEHWHYRHISQDVLPELERRGVTTEQIRQMMVENPRSIFETTKPY
jgi:phosphotriesterase-related protein